MPLKGTSHNKVSGASRKNDKLRTASDVISRLRWEAPEDENGVNTMVLIGYEDRIKGYMEKPLQNYVSVTEGGDIPQHRIWYFRRASAQPQRREEDQPATSSLQLNDSEIGDSILWDRLGRVDRLFHSGRGGGEHVVPHPDTIAHARSAIENMARLEREKAEIRSRKALERARKCRKRSAASNLTSGLFRSSDVATVSSKYAPNHALNSHNYCPLSMCEETPEIPFVANISHENRKSTRYLWKSVPWYFFSTTHQSWQVGTMCTSEKKASTETVDVSSEKHRQMTVVTWNVLFDFYDREEPQEETLHRWNVLGQHLERANADVIALQETTPKFARVLLAQPWVQAGYNASVSPENTESVDRTGNMLLWNRRTMCPAMESSLWLCLDGERKRSLVSALRRAGHETGELVWLIGNVHLLADKVTKLEGTTQSGKTSETPSCKTESRCMARRRELAHVIGKMQQLEQIVLRSSETETARSVQSIILGDFNTSESSLDLSDGCFSGSSASTGVEGYFDDVWPMVAADVAGYTFDAKQNPRAARTQSLMGQFDAPKRIDRIFLGKHRLMKKTFAKRDSGKEHLLVSAVKPISATLLGESSIDDHELPPSDHFGLCATFQREHSELSHGAVDAPSPMLYNEQQPGHNAWAANAISTPDTALVIMLDGDAVLGHMRRRYDELASLPTPHLTLMHGFVELSGPSDTLHLVAKATEDAILAALGPSTPSTEPWSLTFSPTSLNVFEHPSSATLVALPEENEGSWLWRLYRALRVSFRLCNEQESRFAGKWTPHVGLGKFGSSSAARQEILRCKHSGHWFSGKTSIAVHALTLVQRSIHDGEFHPIISVPLARRPETHIELCNTTRFLRNCGTAWSSYMQGKCVPILWEVQNLVNEVVATSPSLGRGKESALETRLQIFGSHGEGTSLPDMSDLDGVIMIQPRSASSAVDEHRNSLDNTQKEAIAKTSGPEVLQNNQGFLRKIASLIETRHPNTQVRMRVAGARGGDLPVLTVKMWPSAPSMDLLLAVFDESGYPMDEKSKTAKSSIMDTSAILKAVRKGMCHSGNWNDQLSDAAFHGAIRVIKLWAYRRGVYGTSSGYLGGGGWGTLFAKFIIDGMRTKALRLPQLCGENDEGVVRICCFSLLKFFFAEASCTTLPAIMSIKHNLDDDCKLFEPFFVANKRQEAIDLANSRSTIAVIAPCSQDNHGRNMTRSTATSILDELQRARNILESGSDVMEPESYESLLIEVLRAKTAKEFAESFDSIIVLSVSVAGSKIPKIQKTDSLALESLEGWGSIQALHMSIELEKLVGDASRVRVLSRPLRIGREWQEHSENENNFGLAWLIGFYGALHDMDGFLDRRSHVLSEMFADKFPHLLSHDTSDGSASCTICVMKSEDATNRIKKPKAE